MNIRNLKSYFKINLGLFCLLILLSTSRFASADGPSFDCKKAKELAEIATCGSAELSGLDNIAAGEYLRLINVKGKAFARKLFLPLWHSVIECGSDTECIRDAKIREIKAFRDALSDIQLGDDSTQEGKILGEPDSSNNGSGQNLGAVILTLTQRQLCMVAFNTQPKKFQTDIYFDEYVKEFRKRGWNENDCIKMFE